MMYVCNSARSRGKLLHGSASRTLQNRIEMAPAWKGWKEAKHEAKTG